MPVGDDHGWLEKVLVEVQLLQRLSHPNLVSYRHVWLEDVKLNRFSPSVPCAFILQQYCNSGDLLQYVAGKNGHLADTNEALKAQMRRRSKGQTEQSQGSKAQKKLPFDEIYSFFRDITSGLAHLHTANYIHRDLKPSNCLLHKGENMLQCLISDFGEVQMEHMVRKSTGATGTISYCAPEVLRHDETGRYGNFTTKSDIFSLGMILYFMCFGRLPYVSAESIQEEFEDLDQLRAEISSWQGFKDERQERPDLPDQLYSFLKRLLSIDPADRPSAAEILQAISTGSGLEGEPSTRADAHIKVGKRVHTVATPAPAGSGSSSAGSTESEMGERDDAMQALARQGEELRKTLSNSETPDRPTPLLMPPPMGYVDKGRRHLAFALRPVYLWTVLNEQLLAYALRLVVFFVKAYTLTKPCLPWATNPWVAYPLLLLAPLDFSLGARVHWGVTSLLLLVHLVALATAGWCDSLCVSGGWGRW